jgi:Ca2+-binding EF-hand superfamily protein
VCRLFDSDSSGTIDSAEFLLHFFRLGFEAKSKERRERIERARRAEQPHTDEKYGATCAHTPRLTHARHREKTGSNLLQWNEEDKLSLMKTLTRIAHACIRETAAYLRDFPHANLTTATFRQVFRRVLGYGLSYAEIGAMNAVIDPNNTGAYVDTSKFVTALLRLGMLPCTLMDPSMYLHTLQSDANVVDWRRQTLQ